ncbi:methenyltetrahydrofolate synthase domain-containing protein-like isoform X1 [Haliotis cracherodii]|uniref:methenyltetrahydrofolate synthase domain-containing protein-like isoform X1 n=1 Tax=Haliotis cracherodii TaxID=6455 RepID=UPI0039EB7782
MSEADKQAPINDNEVDDREEEVRDENQENEEGGGDGDGDGQAKRGNRRQRRNPGNRRRRRNTNDEPEGPIEPIEIGKGTGQEVTKWSIRKQVWDFIEDHNLANFPRPVHHRIPNFKGAVNAAEKVKDLEEFQVAKVVKVNPDKPQQDARFFTLESEKTLLVPTPRLREGLFNKITPPADCNKEILRTCSTSQGVREYSTPIGLDDAVKIDLVIIGSVGVSREGYRIGKGEGFADLEFAMMKTMGAVNENTVVVTTVHDHQVISIPERLVEEHDLTVDYIVTPTEIIKTNCTKPKPTGIIWSKLDRDKLNRVPVLKLLRKRERELGTDVRLKGQEEDDGEDYINDEPEEEKRENDENSYRRRGPPRRRYRNNYRRPRRRSNDVRNSESEEQTEEGEGQGQGQGQGRRPRNSARRGRINRRSHDPSIYVGGLPRSLRVSEFKEKIHDRSVQPLRVVWHGGSGHAFLQFSNIDVAEEAIQALKDLDLGGRQIKVELARSNRGDEDSRNENEADGEVNDAGSD